MSKKTKIPKTVTLNPEDWSALNLAVAMAETTIHFGYTKDEGFAQQVQRARGILTTIIRKGAS